MDDTKAVRLDVEWGVRYPDGHVDVKPEATARAIVECYSDAPTCAVPGLVQRTVSAWREVS